MLFDLIVKIKAPGRDQDSALAWLKRNIPYVEFELEKAELSQNQPAPITGTGSIILPTIQAQAS